MTEKNNKDVVYNFIKLANMSAGKHIKPHHVDQAATALDKLIDPAELRERVEGLRKAGFFDRDRLVFNHALDEVLKLIEEMQNGE